MTEGGVSKFAGAFTFRADLTQEFSDRRIHIARVLGAVEQVAVPFLINLDVGDEAENFASLVTFTTDAPEFPGFNHFGRS